MIYLVDTNVLVHLANRKDSRHQIVRTAMRKLRRAGHQLQIAPQNVAEFWNVVTRPAKQNGLGLTPMNADRSLKLLERLFLLLPESPLVYATWRQLVVEYGVSGIQVHDARLVAMMKVHDITHILTFDTSDFSRYHRIGIVAVSPSDV